MGDSHQPASTETQTRSVVIPAGFHGLIYGVFYGKLKKSLRITDLNAGEVVATYTSCYSGWHTCDVVSAVLSDVTLLLEMDCMNLGCYDLGTSGSLALALTSDIGGTQGQLQSHTYMYQPVDGIFTGERLGITIVVQVGVGPIDVG